jgi:hypothetical protein
MRVLRVAAVGSLLAPLIACETPTPGELDASVRALLSGPLVVGEVEGFQGRFSESIGVDGGTEGAEYLVVVSNLTTSGEGSVSLTLQGEGISTGPATVLGPDGPHPHLEPETRGLDTTMADLPTVQDDRFHHALRRREVALVEALVGRLPGGGQALLLEASPGPQPVPAVGDLLQLNVNIASACEDPDFREGRVEAVSAQAIVVADLANPGGLSRADFEQIARNFDEKVFPLSSRNFGEPARQIGPPRTTIFYTSAVNQLASGFGGLVGGFFFARDLFPRTSQGGFQGCPASNAREMFYMLTADPDGVHGQAIPTDFIRTRTLTTVMHEHQHLVNASRRLYILGTGNLEVVWLNEALSHIAEELLFYQESGLLPGGNLDLEDVRASQQRLDAVNAHQVPNLARYITYLVNPPAHSPIDQEDGLEVRGASWSFLRYLADQHVDDDQDFFRRLVNTDRQGAANLRAELGLELVDPLARWSIANVADDLVPGLSGVHRHPSWNFRSLLPALRQDETFPLTVERMEPGVPFSVSVHSGSAGFVRLGVPAGQRATLTTTAAGGAPPASVRVSLVRFR